MGYNNDNVGRCGSLCPEGRRLESHSSHHVGTLGKSLVELVVACSVRCVNSEYPSCSRERL